MDAVSDCVHCNHTFHETTGLQGKQTMISMKVKFLATGDLKLNYNAYKKKTFTPNVLLYCFHQWEASRGLYPCHCRGDSYRLVRVPAQRALRPGRESMKLPLAGENKWLAISCVNPGSTKAGLQTGQSRHLPHGLCQPGVC